MSVLVGEVSKKANGFQEAVDVANTAMRSMGLPKNTAKKVRTYLVTTQGTKYEQNTLQSFLRNLSPSLKQQVSQNIFAKIVERSWRLAALCIDLAKKSPDVRAKKITLRAAQEELIMLIVANMTNDLQEPDNIVIRQYEKANAMYLIAKGEVKVSIASKCDDRESAEIQKKPLTLRPGQYFGEIGIVYDCVTTATVVATKYCTLASLTKDKFKELTL